MDQLSITLNFFTFAAIIATFVSSVRIVKQYERGIVFRLGKTLKMPKEPGFVLIFPYGVDRMVKVDLRVVTLNVPPQDIITRDNVSMQMDAVV